MAVIVFDNDGVLVNSPEMFSTKLIRDRNLDEKLVVSFFKEIFVPLCMTGKADLKEELKKVLPTWGIQDNVNSILEQWFESENCIDEKVKQLIQQLRKRGIKCYLATNQDKYRTEFMIKQMGFGSLFDGIFSSAFVGYKKPSKEFYEHVLSKISSDILDRNEILYVDDDRNNILVAKEFGVQVCHYKKFKDLENELRRLQII